MKAMKGSYARLPADGSEQLLEWLGKPTLQVSQARAVFFQVQAECFPKGPFFGDLATRGVEIPALWLYIGVTRFLEIARWDGMGPGVFMFEMDSGKAV